MTRCDVREHLDGERRRRRRRLVAASSGRTRSRRERYFDISSAVSNPGASEQSRKKKKSAPREKIKKMRAGVPCGARRRTHLSGQAHELGRAPASVIGPDLRLHDDGAGSAPGRARAARGARATARAALTQQSRFFYPPRGDAQRSRVRSRGRERARGGRGGHHDGGSPSEPPECRGNAEAGIDRVDGQSHALGA